MQINVFSLEIIEAAVVYSFLFIIFLIIIRYFIFAKDIENRQVAKVVGGFAVFIVAILSQNPFVILVSLFIGGLLIATEDFMKQLAIIFRSESKDIGENLKPVSATPQEIKEKQKQEIQETIEIENKRGNKKTLSSSKSTFENRLKLALKYENEVKNYWKQLFSTNFEEDVKIVDPSSGEEIIFDGVLLNPKTRVIEFIFEVRILNTLIDVETIIAMEKYRIKNIFPEIPLVVSLISLGEIKDEDIKRISKLKTNDISISIFEVKNKQIILKV